VLRYCASDFGPSLEFEIAGARVRSIAGLRLTTARAGGAYDYHAVSIRIWPVVLITAILPALFLGRRLYRAAVSSPPLRSFLWRAINIGAVVSAVLCGVVIVLWAWCSWASDTLPVSLPRPSLGTDIVHFMMGQGGVPSWLLALITAALPGVWVWRRNKWRIIRQGFCPECGYDLRATPDRCPECGDVPAGKKTFQTGRRL
jgi:hypothetical protein